MGNDVFAVPATFANDFHQCWERELDKVSDEVCGVRELPAGDLFLHALNNTYFLNVDLKNEPIVFE